MGDRDVLNKVVRNKVATKEPNTLTAESIKAQDMVFPRISVG